MQLCVFSFIVRVVVSIEYLFPTRPCHIIMCSTIGGRCQHPSQFAEQNVSCQEEELCVWDRSGRIEILTYVEYLTRYVM